VTFALPRRTFALPRRTFALPGHTSVLLAGTWTLSGEIFALSIETFTLFTGTFPLSPRTFTVSPGTLAMPILLRLRFEVPGDPAKQTSDDQEFLMDTQDIVEAWRQEAIQEGGRQMLMRNVIEIYEARFGAIPAEIRGAIEGAHDEPTLRAWFKLQLDDVHRILAARGPPLSRSQNWTGRDRLDFHGKQAAWR
jgi:hypothetical protein